MLTRKVIRVLSHGNLWKVSCEHCSKSTIKNTQGESIVLAKKHVADLSVGTLSQIIVQGDNGKFRIEWTYGKDPYPPRG
jgi:predicted RNA binding protein YcfA (HicA-like mRNA interferase family)